MSTRRGHHEGGIRKRLDGRWEATIDLGWDAKGKRKRRYIYSRTRADVATKLRDAQQAIAIGRPLVTDRLRVGTFCDRWLSEVVRPRRSYGHWRNCEGHVRMHIKPAIGHISLAKLTAADVERLVNETRAKDLADDTVRLVHATLRAALGVARRWGLVHENVATLVEPLGVGREEVVPFSPEEIGMLLKEAKGDRLGAYVTVAAALGLRPGEARALQWDDIVLEGTYPSLRVRQAFSRTEGGELLGPPKTARSRRTIALPQQCVLALRAHRVGQLEERLRVGPAWSEGAYVFCTPAGKPLTEKTLSRWFTRLMQQAGVGQHRLYDLRHTAASLLLAQGVHPRVLMDVLGHSTYRLTMDTYSHVMPAAMREAADAMDRALTGACAEETSEPLGGQLGGQTPFV